MAYQLTAEEQKQLKRLQDKRRTLAKRETAFWRQVDVRRDEIMAYLDLADPKPTALDASPAMPPTRQQ